MIYVYIDKDANEIAYSTKVPTQEDLAAVNDDLMDIIQVVSATEVKKALVSEDEPEEGSEDEGPVYSVEWVPPALRR
jgi:hypothetical protein